MIGKVVERREDDRLLRGNGRFVDDIELPDVAHLVVVRSTQPHARIVNVLTDRAALAPGVLGIYTAKDLEAINRPWPARQSANGFVPVSQRILAVDRVRYVGEPIAFIVATDRYKGEDACELVEVEYEPLPGLGSAECSLQADVMIHDQRPGNIAANIAQSVGDVEAALATAPHVIRERFCMARGGAHPMEARATAAAFDPALDTYILWDATQSPHTARRVIATLYGIQEEKIRVIAPPDVGGGFGVKGPRYPEELALPWIARKSGRPVKFIEDRYEHFVSSIQEHPQEHDVAVGFGDDGALIALKDVFVSDVGAYVVTLNVPTIAGATVPGPYRIPNLHIEFTAVFTNKVPQSSVRGAGRPTGVFVMERILDRVAQYLGVDPVTIRLRNLIQPDEFPYAVGLTFRDGSPLTYDSGDYPELLRKGLDLIAYPEQRKAQADRFAEGGYRGIGVSVSLEGVGIGPFEGAIVRLEATGRATVFLGAPPQGQGYETTYAQICAEYLGLEVTDIDVVTGDTGTIPYGIGTFASRVMANAGPAVAAAAMEVKAKLLRSAAAVLEVGVEDLEVADAQVRVRGMQKGLQVSEVAQMCNVGQPGMSMPSGVEPGLTATSYFSPERAGYSSTVQICVVDVDPETGAVTIVDWVAGHDCGRIINPLLVDGQMLGGIAHGLSNALYEESVYAEDGTPLTTSFVDYAIPSAEEMPRVRLYSQETLSPLNPLGVKGAGEAGTLGVPAVVASAVEDALRPFDVRINSSPLSMSVIADLVARAKGGRGAQGAGGLSRTSEGAVG